MAAAAAAAAIWLAASAAAKMLRKLGYRSLKAKKKINGPMRKTWRRMSKTEKAAKSRRR